MAPTKLRARGAIRCPRESRARKGATGRRARADRGGDGDAQARGSRRGDERREPGDQGSESLYQDEFDAGRVRDLEDRLAAIERAEARLADGTYGLSTRSGEPIPDERLEANPTAELTVAEQDPGAK